jgi:hypothetical protein
MQVEENPLDTAARRAVELGNELANDDQQADMWDIADGLLAGAIHYWLYTRQPCSDPMCEECAPISTAEQRMSELQRLCEEFARDSDYFHSPNDSNAGRA